LASKEGNDLALSTAGKRILRWMCAVKLTEGSVGKDHIQNEFKSKSHSQK